MITNGRSPVDKPGVAASISGMTHDAIELAELQTELLACDLKSSGERARNSLILTAVGIALMLSSFPILLIALAILLNTLIDWPPSAGYAVTGALGLLVSASILGAAYSRFKKGILTLERSREELSRNIAWLKGQFSKSGGRRERVLTY